VRARGTVGALLATLVVALPAGAQEPAHPSPEWQARSLENFAHAHGRVRDWALNPAAPPPGGLDPQRAVERWDGARGVAMDVAYRNRYGARIAARLWRPKRLPSRPLPAVVFVDGYGNPMEAYNWAAQDLAEHGYLVMTFDPQGQGASEAEPAPEHCEPGGAWTRPQEMGIREQGSCAGQDPPDTPAREAEGLTFVATGRVGDEDVSGASTVYRKIAPRFVFGTLDAVDHLLSARNPWRRLVDARRVGVAGHSAGAWAALMAANGDPERRFRTGVALDAYHGFDFHVRGTRPTLIVQGEQENVLGPRLVPPSDPRSPNQLHPTRAAFSDLRARGIDAGFYVLRGSTHGEFSDAHGQASSKGQRVTTYLMLAWLDRYLRGDRDGARRLRAERLDAGADASSIGTGTHDPDRGNVPYAIAGERLADHLSFFYPTDLHAAGRTCLDLRLRRC
jgi:dienelactone hydrolase